MTVLTVLIVVIVVVVVLALLGLALAARIAKQYFRVTDAVKSVVAIENVNGDQPDRADYAAEGRRPANPRPDAVRDRQDQPGHPQDPRRVHGALGRRGDPGRDRR